MAKSFSCDGCGTAIVKPIVLGKIIKREYCEECAVAVRAYLRAVDEAHDEVVARWGERKRTLIGDAVNAIGDTDKPYGPLLPDVMVGEGA